MFFIRSYLKWQRSAEQVENERRTARERMEKLRKNKSRSSPDVPLTEVDTDSETPQVDTHSSSSSTTVDDDVDEEIVEKYKPVARLFDREGFHPVDVAVALRRYDLRRQGFGAPVSDAEGWLRKVLKSMATTRSAEPGESKTIQLPDGEYMEFRDGMWVEAEAVS